jgi:hypothetical protein
MAKSVKISNSIDCVDDVYNQLCPMYILAAGHSSLSWLRLKLS